MPTIFSTSADRSAICSPDLTPCARMASLNWAPIDFTGLSAFIALCMTTDRSFHRTEASCLSVSPTMLWPRKMTLPPVRAAGGTRSGAMANRRVDLPQPDSPTTPMNSPRSRSKLTSSTASTVPRSMAYSTDRSRTSRTVPDSPAADLARGLLSATLDTDPPARSRNGDHAPLRDPHAPDRPQGRVPDLVERVVQQRERRAQGDDAQTRDNDPQWRDHECLVVLGPVQHGAPAGHARVAEPDELQAGREQHGVQRVGQEAGHEQ